MPYISSVQSIGFLSLLPADIYSGISALSIPGYGDLPKLNISQQTIPNDHWNIISQLVAISNTLITTSVF